MQTVQCRGFSSCDASGPVLHHASLRTRGSGGGEAGPATIGVRVEALGGTLHDRLLWSTSERAGEAPLCPEAFARQLCAGTSFCD